MHGKEGDIYDFKLNITLVKYPEHHNYEIFLRPHVVAVDMRFVLPEHFSGRDKPAGHTLFCEKDDPMMKNMICRNSWGS